MEEFHIWSINKHVILQLMCTCLFGEIGWGAFRYLSFIARRLAVTLGNTEAKPGMWLRTQINSFSIQSRSWLLQTEMMNIVCKKNKQTRSVKICWSRIFAVFFLVFILIFFNCQVKTYSGPPNLQSPSIWFSKNQYTNTVLQYQTLALKYHFNVFIWSIIMMKHLSLENWYFFSVYILIYLALVYPFANVFGSKG